MPKKRARLPKIKKIKFEEQIILQAADLTRREAKILGRYHKHLRICRNQIKVAADRLVEDGSKLPEIFRQVRLAVTRVEKQVNVALDVYIDQHPGSRWLRSVGLGIEQAVMIYTLIDPDKLTTVSALYRYAGLDPTQVKLKSRDTHAAVRFFQAKYDTKMVTPDIVRAVAEQMNRNVIQILRVSKVEQEGEITWGRLYRALRSSPWNRELKETLYRAGRLFRRGYPMTGGGPYRTLYQQRKTYEDMRNARKDYAALAAKELRDGMHPLKSRSYQIYSQGTLPQSHVDARARRWTVKVLLGHLFEVMYYERHRIRPKMKPYVLDVLGMRHEVICPMWPFKGESGGVDGK